MNVRLGTSLPPHVVAELRPPVEAADAAREALSTALRDAAAEPQPTAAQLAECTRAHASLVSAQRAFESALTANGYRTDRPHSFVVRNVLTCLRDDFGVRPSALRAVLLGLVESPPFAEDRATVPLELQNVWSRSIGRIPV